MKILQVSSASYTVGGGISEYVRNVSERLAKKHEVVVFGVNTKNLPSLEVVNGVTIRRFRCFAPGNAFYLPLAMPIKLLKEKADVVHGYQYHAIPMHLAPLANSKRFYVSPSFHGSGHTPLRNHLLRLLKPIGARTLQSADSIFAASEYEKMLLVKELNVKPSRISVIPRGIDFSEFRSLKKHEKGYKSILYVGRLIDYKGVQHLVEVLPKLSEDISLEIVGKGPLRKGLEERAKRLNVGQRVKFYQDVKRTRLIQMYADADVFVLPSKFEAYSKVVAEALAARTPCIVANTSALTEWIDNEVCYGVDLPVNLDDLASLIQGVLEKRINKDSFGREFSKKIIDWDEVVLRLEHSYNI